MAWNLPFSLLWKQTFSRYPGPFSDQATTDSGFLDYGGIRILVSGFQFLDTGFAVVVDVASGAIVQF